MKEKNYEHYRIQWLWPSTKKLLNRLSKRLGVHMIEIIDRALKDYDRHN